MSESALQSLSRTRLRSIKSREDQGLGLVGESIQIKGWVRTVRDQKKFLFMDVNDGSTLSNLQVILDGTSPDYARLAKELTTGAAVSVEGELVESPGKGQAVEIKATAIEIVGTCPADTYPLQKKRHSMEFLREIAHLRPRTNSLGAVSRVRSCLAQASHAFFREQNFHYVQTPIITASDCEGAGEMFRVTTLDMENLPKKEDGAVDYTQDFFRKSAFLTVSGQLNAEIYATALSDVYTFGPTFRAENSNTGRHLAEFWMLEPEIAFADLNDDMDLAEAYLQYVLKDVIARCSEDLDLFNRFVDKGLLERLTTVANTPFARMSYTDAVKALEESGKEFEFPCTWGSDLQTEHERYLSEELVKGPVIIYNYPKGIKSFYMRMNDDNETVAAMDVLVPRIGELIGGSQREERLDVLEKRLEDCGLPQEEYWWYLELRKYGSVPHAGFGLGFERLVQFVTGMENIREAVAFPRCPGNVEF